MTHTHHSFSLEVAQEYGVEAAILIHHFQHWISFNKRTKKNLHDGRTWMYQTLDDLAAHFPYFTKDKIRDILDLLAEGKTRKMKGVKCKPVLLRGNYNKSGFDRTIWYAFEDEKAWLNQKSLTKWEKAQKETVDITSPKGTSPTPIPYTKTDTKNKHTGSVSVYPCLEKLDLSSFERQELMSYGGKHTEQEMEMAVSKTLAWNNRSCDIAAIKHILATKENWRDDTPQEIDRYRKYQNNYINELKRKNPKMAKEIEEYNLDFPPQCAQIRILNASDSKTHVLVDMNTENGKKAYLEAYKRISQAR